MVPHSLTPGMSDSYFYFQLSPIYSYRSPTPHKIVTILALSGSRKLNRVRDTRDDSGTNLRKHLSRNVYNMIKIPATRERTPATHSRKLRTPTNVSRHFTNSLANAVRNLSPTVAVQ